MLRFGYENEYFLEKDGKILGSIPDWSLPHDAAGVLVEVRGEPFPNPFQAQASFEQKLDDLATLVAKHNCKLKCLTKAVNETAGFHIHFSLPEWKGLHPKLLYGADPPDDIAKWIARLDKRFEKVVRAAGVPPHYWRPKPYGWEYRRLPATVDVSLVTQVLAEEFWDGQTDIDHLIEQVKAA